MLRTEWIYRLYLVLFLILLAGCVSQPGSDEVEVIQVKTDPPTAVFTPRATATVTPLTPSPVGTKVAVTPALSTTTPTAEGETPMTTGSGSVADVVSVDVSGEGGNYTFSVGIRSPDEGCQQYADWWEVISEEGDLLYRRILLHSHVGEQPFVRSGGPVKIAADSVVWVRAHMNPGGYGGTVWKGSIAAGLSPAELDPGFAAHLEETPPFPGDCAF